MKVAGVSTWAKVPTSNVLVQKYCEGEILNGTLEYNNSLNWLRVFVVKCH